MRPLTPRSYFIIAGLLVAVGACSDSGTISAPDSGATAIDHKASTPGDTATKGSPTAPATPATPSDTAVTTPAPPSTPVDSTPATPPIVPATSIDLSVTVGVPVPGRDTLAFTALANAKVTVYGRTLVVTPGAGADSVKVTEAVVATATTDAGGKVSFADLPAAPYRIEAVADGSSGARASVTLATPYPRTVAITLIIRPGA